VGTAGVTAAATRSSESEFELIEAIRARFADRGGRVVIGPGDDAAVTRSDGLTVTSVDGFVEGVHFRLATTSMRDLGHKCLAGAVSDIAAMGAAPGEAYFVMGLPAHLAPDEVTDFAEGAEALAAELGFVICGGDLSRSDELVVSVTTTGHARDERDLVSRSGARPGDRIGVTGALGGAGAGLLLLERKLGGLDIQTGEALIARQLRPRPRIEAGQALARAGVHAMIDVSDGIASDAARLSERSGVLIEIELARLPIDDGVPAVAKQAGIDPLELAAGAGEDYELLFAVADEEAHAAEAAADEAGTSVTWVGRVRAGSGVRLLAEDGTDRSIAGWNHLASRSAPPAPA
jgi:thiamine-monophosphate kinase